MKNDKELLIVDEEVSGMLAKELVKPFNEARVEDTLTILNAFTVALLSIAREANKECSSNTTDGVEKIVLSWLRSCDIPSGLHFGRYISLPDDNPTYCMSNISDIAS